MLAWNTADRLSDNEFGDMVHRFDPDIMVLPETSESQLQYVLGKMGDYSTEVDVFTTQTTDVVAPTSVVINKRTGDYQVAAGIATTFGAITLEPISDQFLPVIIGLHTAPPLPGLMENWRADLEVAASAAGCGDNMADSNIVTAGDFNATLRHGALANRIGCIDAQQAVNKGRQGTWPAAIPGWLGAPIDHILVHGEMRVVSSDTFKLGTSDHRAIVATISLS